MRRLWLFNLDAERELAMWPRFAGPGPRSPLDEAVRGAAHALLGPGDAPFGPAIAGAPASVSVGVPWCATPGALAVLRGAGLEPESEPPVELLLAAASRRLHTELPGAPWNTRWVAEMEALPSGGGGWIAKRPFTSGGRGVRRFRTGFSPGELVRGDWEWLVASMSLGGLEVTPLLSVERELARHGFLGRDGSLRVGRTTEQRVDPRGRWLASEVAEGLDSAMERMLGDCLEALARELFARGYAGPLGVDALVHRGPRGLELCARSELHCRYSLGYAVGMGRVDRVALGGGLGVADPAVAAGD